ncbi:MAG: DUF1622 domain-containing protein [Gammaproteobacteria bacterium]|nr:DUF1622 domain-containing protein [Gammaproteobacteria bacterium]
MHEFLVQGVGYVVPWIEAVGIVIVAWGVFEGLARLGRRVWAVAAQGETQWEFSDIRFAIGEKMVLGLEFFLAGDIIQTIVVPTWESLGTLAGIVGIRTIIVYFLYREINADRREPRRNPDDRLRGKKT